MQPHIGVRWRQEIEPLPSRRPVLARVYPPEHEVLAEQVSAQGPILSESPLQQEPLLRLFPQRNRIISGLSLGVLIVEASKKSGSLHTACHAMEQGCEDFALPGRVDNLASEGCHNLIRDGATLTELEMKRMIYRLPGRYLVRVTS